MSKEAAPSGLRFQDGDDVLLTHLDSGRRLWTNGVEAFSKVHVHEDHIEFRHMDDDGRDLAEIRPVDEVSEYEFYRQLGDVAYVGAILYEGESTWTWDSVGAPHPSTINDFRQRRLTPLGAHSFPLEVRDGDGRDGEFSLQAIMDSLIEKKLPVGASAGYYAHDMHDHAISLSAIDRQCMKSLRQLAIFSGDLAPSFRYESRRVALGIANSLDYYSFYRYFSTKFALRSTDPLLSDVLEYSYNFNSKHSEHMRKILRKNGYGVSGHTVTRSPETVAYYRRAIDVLDPRDTSDIE